RCARLPRRAGPRREGIRPGVPHGRGRPRPRRRTGGGCAMTVFVVKGADPALRDRALDELVAELVGPGDRGLVLEESAVAARAGAGGDDPVGSGGEARRAVVPAVLNAATSPPFMTDRRIVVVRDAGALTAADVEPLVRYLADPLDTTV